MEGGDDAGRHEIDPDAGARPLVRIAGEQAHGSRIRVLEELAHDGAFVERLAGVLEGGDETAGVEGQ